MVKPRFVVAALLWSAAASAQPIALRVGHLVDPASGTLSRDQTILVQDGRVASVGPTSTAGLPADVPIVDLSKAWVLPGLMDAHHHLTGELPPAPDGGSVWESFLLKESTALRALRGVRIARTVLEAGFTTVRDLGNSANYADVDVRRAIERGWFPGPTIISSGKMVAPYGGQFHELAAEHGPFWHFEYIDADTPDEIRKAIRQNVFYGATVIKIVADNNAYTYSEADFHAAVTEAHKAGLKVAVHAYGGEGARAAILGGVDSIEHGYNLSDDLLQLMHERGTFLVPTVRPYEHLVPMSAFIAVPPRVRAEQTIERLRRAYGLGVKLAFGTDAFVALPARDRGEIMKEYLATWSAAGLPAPAILKALTTQAAELLGLRGTRGAIRVGEAADIIAVAHDPLARIDALTQVVFVMKDGRIVRGGPQPRR